MKIEGKSNKERPDYNGTQNEQWESDINIYTQL